MIRINNENKYENRNNPRNKRVRKSVECFSICCNGKKARARSETFPDGQAVECEGLTHLKFNVDEQLKKIVEVGGEILACGTCLKSRNQESTDTCPFPPWWIV